MTRLGVGHFSWRRFFLAQKIPPEVRDFLCEGYSSWSRTLLGTGHCRWFFLEYEILLGVGVNRSSLSKRISLEQATAGGSSESKTLVLE